MIILNFNSLAAKCQCSAYLVIVFASIIGIPIIIHDAIVNNHHRRADLRDALIGTALSLFCLWFLFVTKYVWARVEVYDDKLVQVLFGRRNVIDLASGLNTGFARLSVPGGYERRAELPIHLRAPQGSRMLTTRKWYTSWIAEVTQGSERIVLSPPYLSPQVTKGQLPPVMHDIWQAYEDRGYM